MIEPKELQIGNWVSIPRDDGGYSYFKVKTFTRNMASICSENSPSISTQVYVKDLEPIPITEEKLEELGAP